VDATRRDSIAPYLLLAAVLVLATVALLTLGDGLTFYQDTWAYLLDRTGFSADVFLSPHNEHIVVIPVALEKLLVEVFGMSSALPEYLALDAMLLVTAVLVFVYVKRRLGPWPALLATVLVLFLGPAWQVLLWPFEIALVGSTMTGLAMLLALEREDRRGDVAACVLLAISILFSSLGVAFAAGALIHVFGHRRRLGLRRLYVPAVGLGIYAAWYLGYGHDAESHLSAHNVIHSPIFVAEGLSASVGAVSGLTALSDNPAGRPYLGFALLVVLVGLLAWRLWRHPRIPASFWPTAATAAAFWFLAAFNRSPGREAQANRYMHFGAILILLMAADLLRGARLGVRALLVAAAVVLAITAVNFDELENGRDALKEQTLLTRSDLAAMEIASRTIAPDFVLSPEVSGSPSLIDVDAASYFPVVREHGSPAYTEQELADAPELGRAWADVVLAAALPIGTATGPLPQPLPDPGSCRTLPAGGGQALRIGPGKTEVLLGKGPEATLSLRRFAVGEFPVNLATAPGDSMVLVDIPADRSSRPWWLRVEASQAARVCS